MKDNFLGIDYGAKRIGVAVADKATRLATPLLVIQAEGKSLATIVGEVAEIAEAKGAGAIVVGESKDFNGVDNVIMKKTRAFAMALAKKTGKQIVFEPEFMTTQQAERLQGKGALIDSSAAALILQSYLDRQ